MCKLDSQDVLSPRELKIVKLNDRVTTLTTEAVDEANKANKAAGKREDAVDTPLYIVHAQQKMTFLTAGLPVYQKRSAAMVYLYSVFAAVLVLEAVTTTGLNPLVSLLCLAIVFIGYDIYSGVLHVVFDHPANIALPIIGQPCLEFQWHHAIPDDLVRKDFVDVCGDLNMVVGILAVANLYLLDISSPIARLVGGLKLSMAYFGQFSHRSAHTHGPQRPSIARFLQNTGFMISSKEHMIHHKEPHDLDFCLIGVCNPLIDAMRTVTTNNTIWLSVFLVWSIFDMLAYTKLVEYLASSYL